MAVGAVIGNPSKHCRKAMLAIFLSYIPMLLLSCNEIHYASFAVRFTPYPLNSPLFMYAACSHKPHFIYSKEAVLSLAQEESRFQNAFFRSGRNNLHTSAIDQGVHVLVWWF